MEQPKFLTCKYQISNLNSVLNVYDFQLRDHFLNSNNLYVTTCSCMVHKHNKNRCKIVDTQFCVKCKQPTKFLMSFEMLLAHGPDISTKELFICCKHVHHPPCRRCLYCNIVPLNGGNDDGSSSQGEYSCIIKKPFECFYTCDVVCPYHPNNFTKCIDLNNIMLREHIYNMKLPIFYFCFVHAHRHKSHIDKICYIQTFKCCEHAVCVQDYDSSFIVTVSTTLSSSASSSSNNNVNDTKEQDDDDEDCDDFDANLTTTNVPIIGTKRKRRQSKRMNGRQKLIGKPKINKNKSKEFIIFDPRIWREQSLNHFVSFIRAVIVMPEAAKDRYTRFEESNFSISNVKKYKSGKESIVRLAVTGFETKGIYQTSTISCIIPHYKTIIPQMLYDLLVEQGYDTSLVCIKRDPSIKSTCMFVCKAERNPDPSFRTIIIPDAISRPMNQDQISIIYYYYYT